MIKYLDKDNNFDELIKKDIILVDFYADWCGPCKMLGSVLENIDFNILKVNTDTFPDLAQRFGVMSIPTVIIFKKGEEVSKFVGFRSKEEIEKILSDI